MNRFLEQLASLYTPMRLRGLLMDGQYRFAPDQPTPGVPTRHPRAPIVAEAAPTGACPHRFASLHR
jgi:hypothetical protein